MTIRSNAGIVKMYATDPGARYRAERKWIMTGKERALACIAGTQSDHPAVICPVSVATTESCNVLGISFQDVHLNADKMAALAAFGAKELGFDSVMPYFSVIQEAAALGCEIHWGGPAAMPTQKNPPYEEPEDFILPDDFLERISISTVLDAIKLLKKDFDDKTLIIGKAMGPWTLSYHLHGVENTLYDTIVEKERLHDFIKRFTKVTKTFVQAQFDSGADVVTIADHITADLTGAHVYEEFLKEAHRDIIQCFGGERLIFHCCGNTVDRLALFADAGWTLFHIDSKNDIKEALKEIGEMKLTGYISNQSALVNGDPEIVAAEVKDILSNGIRLVSPECAVPLIVRNENLVAIKKSVVKQSS